MTNMKPVTNKEIAQAFRDTIPHLSDGVIYGYPKSSYICLALELGCGNRLTFLAAKEIITHRLGKDADDYAHTMDSWLVDNGVSTRDMTEERVQAHRLAWLNLLIEEFENKE
jgi:hypothetical protein